MMVLVMIVMIKEVYHDTGTCLVMIGHDIHHDGGTFILPNNDLLSEHDDLCVRG